MSNKVQSLVGRLRRYGKIPIGRYRGVTLQRELVNKIEEYIKAHPEMGYKSLADFITDAIREKCEQLKILTPPEMPTRTLQSKRKRSPHTQQNTRKRILKRPHSKRLLQTRPIICEYCQTNNCRHIQFTLTIPKIREIVWKKREEGWNLLKPREI